MRWTERTLAGRTVFILGLISSSTAIGWQKTSRAAQQHGPSLRHATVWFLRRSSPTWRANHVRCRLPMQNLIRWIRTSSQMSLSRIEGHARSAHQATSEGFPTVAGTSHSYLSVSPLFTFSRLVVCRWAATLLGMRTHVYSAAVSSHDTFRAALEAKTGITPPAPSLPRPCRAGS
jgi:hypothetical protein